MIIDFHAHIFPDRIAAATVDKLKEDSRTQPFSDGAAGGLRASMARAGVARTVVLPVGTNPLKLRSVNDASLRVNAEDDGLICFAATHPDAPDWRQELDRCAAAGMKGVKLHPVYQGVDLDDPRFLRIMERAGELGLIVVSHMGDDIGRPGEVRCTPEMARAALRQVGPVRFVAAHMGGWRNWDRVVDALGDTGAYLDTAFSLGRLTPLTPDAYAEAELRLLQAEDFCALARAFGSERVLFGSDSPWADQAADLAQLRALPLTEAEKANILGESARRLLGLPEEETDEGTEEVSR